jgi:hypothetical protein
MHPRRSLTYSPAIPLLIVLVAAFALLSSVTACASPLARLIASHRHPTHRLLLPGELALAPSSAPHACVPAFVDQIRTASIAPRLAPRVFLDDTPPPSLESLQIARVESGLLSPGPRAFRAAPRRMGSFSVCNRQRAP